MLKRTFDLITSGVGLMLLAPLFLVIAIWIKIDSPGAIFFRQERVGQYGRMFRIHKFRTMSEKQDNHRLITIGNDSRVTRSGQFLRKYKLDELPQLIDVFQGKMSLVGPRPEVPYYMDCYPSDLRKEVLSVRPGITDYASIEMVDENQILASYSDPEQAYVDVVLPLKQKYYQKYVRSHGFFEDLRIIALTVLKVFSPKRNRE